MSGFGSTVVYGLRRVPLPPARITACMARPSEGVAGGFVHVQMLLHESDRLLERLFEAVPGLPPAKVAGPAVIADEPVDLALGRPESLSRLDHFQIRTHEGEDGGREVADGDASAEAHVHGLAEG